MLAKRFELTELESIVTQLQMRFSFLVLKILTELARDFRSVCGCQWAFGRRQYRGSVFRVFEKYVEVWNKFIRLDIEVGYLFIISDIIYRDYMKKFKYKICFKIIFIYIENLKRINFFSKN